MTIKQKNLLGKGEQDDEDSVDGVEGTAGDQKQVRYKSKNLDIASHLYFVLYSQVSKHNKIVSILVVDLV
jgi:hypothetical protein